MIRSVKLVFLFDILDFPVKFLFKERFLRLKELKSMVLELRMMVPAGMREGLLGHMVGDFKSQEKVLIRTQCDKI